MTAIQILIIVPMILSAVGSVFLLWLLYTKTRAVYGTITAWRFIFAGFVQMFLEILCGVALLMPWLPREWRILLSVAFCWLMLTKVYSYVIGFALWASYRQRLLDPKRWKIRNGG